MSASFEEKSVWVQLIGTAVGLGAYFVAAARMMRAGVMELAPYVPLFMVAVVFMVILLIVGFILAALTGRHDEADERDRVIAWRAEHNSGWLLAVGVLGAVTAMAFKMESVWIAHMLLLSLCLSEVLGFVLRIVYYRRGIGGA